MKNGLFDEYNNSKIAENSVLLPLLFVSLAISGSASEEIECEADSEGLHPLGYSPDVITMIRNGTNHVNCLDSVTRSAYSYKMCSYLFLVRLATVVQTAPIHTYLVSVTYIVRCAFNVQSFFMLVWL